MVRRSNGTLSDVADFSRLAIAFHRAARSKRAHAEVKAFAHRLDFNLGRLGAEIESFRAPRNLFHRFQIRDPKPRVIHAPVFEDRVVHHALIDVIGADLDRALIPDTFACREGKGSLAAVLRAQHHVRRWPWYVKIDIAKYFASIPHDRLVTAVTKKLKDRALRRFVERIVGGFEGTPARGLPIGALTSQHFANLYLAPLDRHLCNHPAVRGMVRYLDDVVWWCETKDDAKCTLAGVRRLVPEVLGLELKRGGFVQRSGAGLSFLGFRIYAGALKLSRRRQTRYRASRRKWETAFAFGKLTDLELQRGYDAAFAITAHAAARGFRARDLGAFPAPDV